MTIFDKKNLSSVKHSWKPHVDKEYQLFKENGIINFLIGESLMKEKNLTLATKTILGNKIEQKWTYTFW